MDQLFGLFDAAELDDGLLAGSFGGHVMREVVVDVELEMGGELIV